MAFNFRLPWKVQLLFYVNPEIETDGVFLNINLGPVHMVLGMLRSHVLKVILPQPK